MTNSDFRESVSAEIRRDIALARERAELADAIRGSVLWYRLAIQTDDCGDGSGYCSECGYETERYDVEDGDWVCADCAAESVRERASEDRHNDPRTGQAADLNRGNF